MKRPEPRGEAAFLPCPRSEAEGTCAYRRLNCCTDDVRAVSLQDGHGCVIERLMYEYELKNLIAALDYKDGETPGPSVMTAAGACIEAYLYLRRAMFYNGEIMTKAITDPSPFTVIRYQGLGFSAWLRRREDVAVARMQELGLDIDKVREQSEGRMWAWWRESCRARWMRDYVKKESAAAS